MKTEFANIKRQLSAATNRIRTLEARNSGGTFQNSTNISPIPKYPKLLIFFASFLLCSYQAYSITEVYLKHDVIAEALFFPTDPIKPPMVTLCVKREQNTSLLLDSRDVFAANVNFSQIVPDFRFKHPELGYVYVKKKTIPKIKFTTFMLMNQMCYAIDLDKIAIYFNRTYVYTFIEARAASHQILFRIELHSKFCETTSSCTATLGEPGNFAIKEVGGIPIEPNSSVTIFYEKQELSLMPPPYTTDCFDYSLVGAKNQDDCILKCIKRESLTIKNLAEEYLNVKVENSRHHNITYDESNDTQTVNSNSKNQSTVPNYVPVFRREHYRIDMTNPLELFPRLKICKKQCSRVPCKLTQFTTTSIRTKFSKPLLSELTVKLPQNGELKVFYKPKVTMVEYVTLFGSVFSLWFGISAFQLVNQFTNLVYKKITKL